MSFLHTRSYRLPAQIIFSTLTVLFIAAACFLARDIIGYKVVALLLLSGVSVLAILFEILPVLAACLLSALLLNFFFIPPYYTFHIAGADDMLLFGIYFSVAIINAVLTVRIRREEAKSRDKAEKEKTIQLYNTLLSSLSHELKTPVATILGAVDTLKENSGNLQAGPRAELLQQIDTASIRLNRQVENLLSMSRLETGLLQLHLEWCDVNELIHRSIQKFNAPDANRRRHILFVPNEALPLCKLDMGIMEQVVDNLVSNALLYTPESASISVTAGLAHNQLVIAVTDTGMGVPEALLPEIFNKFYRLPQSRTGGTGLGLSIVKGFVEAHGGHISAASQVPHGLKVTLTIPAELSYVNHLKHE